jgi:hypothetical protein
MKLLTLDGGVKRRQWPPEVVGMSVSEGGFGDGGKGLSQSWTRPRSARRRCSQDARLWNDAGSQREADGMSSHRPNIGSSLVPSSHMGPKVPMWRRFHQDRAVLNTTAREDSEISSIYLVLRRSSVRSELARCSCPAWAPPISSATPEHRKRPRNTLRFVCHRALGELHDAHRVSGYTVVRDDALAHPEVLTTNDAKDREVPTGRVSAPLSGNGFAAA